MRRSSWLRPPRMPPIRHSATCLFKRSSWRQTIRLLQAAVHAAKRINPFGLFTRCRQTPKRLASRILYSDPSLRPGPQVLSMNSKTQADLWPYGIGGDTPIVLVRISRPEDLPSVRQLVKAHEYLRMKGLVFDLVILNEHPADY